MSMRTFRPRVWASADELVEVLERAEPGIDVAVVGDVVAAVGQR